MRFGFISLIATVAVIAAVNHVSPLFPERSPVQHFGSCFDHPKDTPARATCVSNKMAQWDNQPVVAPPQGTSLASISFFDWEARN